MKWIDINEQAPIDIGKYSMGTTYLVTIKCDTWTTSKTMVMEWQEIVIRNKMVKRWKWNDRIKEEAWIVTHWMELPQPAM